MKPSDKRRIKFMAEDKNRGFRARDSSDSDKIHYELQNGLTIDSSSPLSVYGSNNGNSLILYFDALSSEMITIADVILEGLVPLTKYHIFMDNYHNETIYETGSDGLYRLKINTGEDHAIFFHTSPSIVFLSDNGWSDSRVGSYDPMLKTAYLTKNASATIQVDLDGVILNGKNYIINGSGKDLLFGVFVPGRKNISVTNTKIINCRDGISLRNCSECSVKQCFCARNDYGISVNLSNKTSILQNRGEFNSVYGIKLYKSITGDINENIISMSGECAIDCEMSTFNTMSINGIYNNTNGGLRFRSYSFENIIEKNLLINNDCGISLESHSFNCRILNNIIYSSLLSVEIDNCHAVDILDNELLLGNGDGIDINTSDGCNIKGNSATLNKGYGVRFTYAHRIDFSFNVLNSNKNSGMKLDYCDNCIISSNDIKYNNSGGIDLYQSHFNNINGNNITENSVFGIQTQRANSNEIYNNNFIDNDKQVNDINSTNKFFKAKPDGGNYWSDSDESDGSKDGISENVYIISKKNEDEFPWAKESGWNKNSPNKKASIKTITGGTEETLKSMELLKRNLNTLGS